MLQEYLESVAARTSGCPKGAERCEYPADFHEVELPQFALHKRIASVGVLVNQNQHSDEHQREATKEPTAQSARCDCRCGFSRWIVWRIVGHLWHTTEGIYDTDATDAKVD